jgi:hypothetical protein
MRRPISVSLLMLSLATTDMTAQRAESLTADVLKYVRPTGARIVHVHVEIIDGAGVPPLMDRNGRGTALRVGVMEQPRRADEPPGIQLIGHCKAALKGPSTCVE